MKNKTIAQAKKIFHDYKIIDKLTAGIVLTGNEIKSLRESRVSINNSYVAPHQNELYVVNMNIAIYKYSHASDLLKTDTKKKRKLLLEKKEIKKLISIMKSKSYVLVPLRLFISEKGWAKLEIALAQRLRKYQIKEKIKEKEIKKKMNRREDF